MPSSHGEFPRKNPVELPRVDGHNRSVSWPLPRDYMLQRMLAADASCDGQFITGVLSTGIYCLPSCRARKPKPDNVVFYPTPGAAQSGGLRACRRCKPDDFYAGVDPSERHLETTLAHLSLGQVPNVGALAACLGVGSSRLNVLFRTYYHVTPSEWLAKRRIQAVQELLLTCSQPAAQLAFEVGFESLSAFGEQFRRWSAVSPQAFRLLPTAAGFSLDLPANYPTSLMLRDLGRDIQQTTTRVEQDTLRTVVRLTAGHTLLRLRFEDHRVHVERTPGGVLTPRDALVLHESLIRLLGLHCDPSRFEQQASAHPALAPLLEAQRGLRIPLTADPFDGLVWAIVGQQVTFAAACKLRRRLLERTSTVVSEGLYVPPDPRAIGDLDVSTLRALGLTNTRALALQQVARLVDSGALDLLQLARGTATHAEEVLLSIPGLGPWTAQYVLLRVLGFQDAAPLGDSALQSALQHVFTLSHRPDAAQVKELLTAFAPHRSLATLHLWQHHNRSSYA